MGPATDTAFNADRAAEVPRRMAAWRADVAERLNSDEVPVSMARLMTEINSAMPADGILVADAASPPIGRGAVRHKEGRACLRPDPGSASIGDGLPGAMGAAMAAPGRPVFSRTATAAST